MLNDVQMMVNDVQLIVNYVQMMVKDAQMIVNYVQMMVNDAQQVINDAQLMENDKVHLAIQYMRNFEEIDTNMLWTYTILVRFTLELTCLFLYFFPTWQCANFHLTKICHTNDINLEVYY